MKQHQSLPFLLRASVLAKLPAMLLVGIFSIPILLINFNQSIGLFFIAFYISYWTVKVFESYYYILRSYRELLDYDSMNLAHNELVLENGKHLQHVVVVPIYTEPYDVIEENVTSILKNDYPYLENITILLATEQRAPHGEEHAQAIMEKFKKSPVKIINIIHPD